MNKLLKLTSLGFAAFAMVMTSCSDDDNDAPVLPVEPSISNVFSQGLPKVADGYKFTTNDKGQVTKIEDDYDVVTFEYGRGSRAITYDVVMKIREKEYPTAGSDIYMQLNNQGFVTYALQVYLNDENEDDTWQFEYNADGQMTRIRRSENENDVRITYVDGNISKYIETWEGDDEREEYTIKYTNDKFKTPVANKGNLMMFDEFFDIDMDEMGIAYFAGLLGKSTKNLPMGYTYSDIEGDNSVSYTGSDNFNWTLNSQGFPTKFWKDNYEYEATTFTW